MCSARARAWHVLFGRVCVCNPLVPSGGRCARIWFYGCRLWTLAFTQIIVHIRSGRDSGLVRPASRRPALAALHETQRIHMGAGPTLPHCAWHMVIMLGVISVIWRRIVNTLGYRIVALKRRSLRGWWARGSPLGLPSTKRSTQSPIHTGNLKTTTLGIQRTIAAQRNTQHMTIVTRHTRYTGARPRTADNHNNSVQPTINNSHYTIPYRQTTQRTNNEPPSAHNTWRNRAHTHHTTSRTTL